MRSPKKPRKSAKVSVLHENKVRRVLEKLPFMKGRVDAHVIEVAQGAMAALVLRGIGAGFGFGFSLLLAKKYGASGMGLYALVLSAVSIATVFGRFGLDNAVLRMVAANASVKKWTFVRGVFRRTMEAGLWFSVPSSAALFLGAQWIANTVFRKPELTDLLKGGALAVTPLSLLILQAEMLKGLKRIKESLFVNGIAVPLISLAGLSLVPVSWGVKGAVGSFAIACLAGSSGGFALWRAAMGKSAGPASPISFSRLLGSGIPLFWVSLLDLFESWTSTFLLGIWNDSKQIGVFTAANRTAGLIAVILVAVNSILAPKFAALHHRKDMEALGSTARRSAQMTLVITGPFLLGLMVFPGFVMGIFGNEFRAGAPLLMILAASQFIGVATGSVGYLLVMSGHEKLFRDRAVLVAGLNVVLNLLLVPWLGVLGAAISTALCIAFSRLIGVYFVRKYLGIWTVPGLGRLMDAKGA